MNNSLESASFLGVGDGGDDGGGIIFSEHPSPILHAPRDNISRKGNPSLWPMLWLQCIICFYSFLQEQSFSQRGQRAWQAIGHWQLFPPATTLLEKLLCNRV
jgi:hypothetical protein